MKKLLWGLVLIIPLAVLAGGNPGNPYRKYTAEDTVKWVLTDLRFAYNEGLVSDALLNFSSNYNDANGVNFSALSSLLAALLRNADKESDPFLFYNAKARVIGNQAVLTATFLIQPMEVTVGKTGTIVARDTITLDRLNGKWLIKSAPHLVSALAQVEVMDSVYRTQDGGGRNAQ